jgi:hypothetical protein
VLFDGRSALSMRAVMAGSSMLALVVYWLLARPPDRRIHSQAAESPAANHPGANVFMRTGRKSDLDPRPTVKPIAMVADAILESTNLDDLILDLFSAVRRPCLPPNVRGADVMGQNSIHSMSIQPPCVGNRYGSRSRPPRFASARGTTLHLAPISSVHASPRRRIIGVLEDLEHPQSEAERFFNNLEGST